MAGLPVLEGQLALEGQPALVGAELALAALGAVQEPVAAAAAPVAAP